MVGIALLGAGIFAREAHVPAILKNAAAKVLAVYSRSENSANSVVEALNNTTTPIDVYSDEKPGHGLDELLQRPDIEAVIVLLPILVLPAVVRKCLAAGKHVLAEKPIAKDIATGRALITEYETTYAPRNLVFSVAEQFRYDTGFLKASEVVASGTIGELHHVHARVATSMAPENKYFQTAWRVEPGYQGGFVLDAGVHFVALVRMVAGQEIVETKSFTAQFAPHLRPLDTVNAALRFSKGAQGTLSISFAAATYIADFVFIGTAGVLTVKCAGVDTTVRVEGGDRNVVSEEVFPADGNVNEIRAFVQAIAAGKGDRAGSPREALADVAVIESVCAGGGLVQSHEI
ncbi:NAD-binding Rossmann fold oxidoreductase [Blastomyces dermatitidis ATCC 18188]|uniref:NAD-binding Rossmann fold oxidoreductase n=1 Tax=Ajellomyces dermatitidis (strain ATCC 18188 / CBS 674.68) TaxID=653446 RepID=F2TL50_AJEDA|nr:NAD-binding Rossmann fold oxidoreductase [Blastomyces dermatitidis ATCC 18188]